MPEPYTEFAQGDSEPDLLYRYRWVATLKYHPREPSFLEPYRKMLKEKPVEFFKLYQAQQARFDDSIKEQAKMEQVAKPVAEEDTSVAECVALVEKLIHEHLEREKLSA